MQQDKELSYDQLFLQADYDDKKLTEFNPALVYGFEAEASVQTSKRDPYSIEFLLHGIGQHQDMYNAYIYAQDVIISEAKQLGFNNITPEKVIFWLDQIHKRIAATLAADRIDAGMKGVKAGECSERMIMRWHNGADITAMLSTYLSGFAPAGTDMALSLAAKGIEKETATKFMRILNKIKKDDTIKAPESELKFMNMDNPLLQGNLIITKLSVFYHSNKSTKNERECIDKIVKICTPPSEFPKIRQQFAVNFLAKLRATDPTNKKSVIELAYFVFYGITEGHWWFNANGRTAVCFLNTVFRLLGKPSILVRNPNEKSSANSSYAQAILMIDTNPQLLFKHFENRLDETEKGIVYADPLESETVSLKVAVAKLILRIKFEFPEFQINDFFKRTHIIHSTRLLPTFPQQEKLINEVLKCHLKSLGSLHTQLTEKKNKSFISTLAKDAPENKKQPDESSDNPLPKP